MAKKPMTKSEMVTHFAKKLELSKKTSSRAKAESKARKLCSVCALLLGLAILFLPMGSFSQAQQRLNGAIAKLSEGKTIFGVWSSNRDLRNARMIGGANIDYVIYDTEHQPFDMHNFHQFLMNLRGPDGKFKVTPFIRIPAYGREVEKNNWVVKQVLDLGAMGIIFPHIDTPEMAEQAVSSMRYPAFKDSPYQTPPGHRGWSPGEATAAWGISAAEYGKRADLWPLNPNGELLLIVLIESPMAIENLDKILSVPGVGAVFVGPMDLQSNMGYRGQGFTMPGAGAPAANTAKPDAEQLIQKALATCKKHNTPVAILTNSMDVKARVAQGFNMPTIGSDGGFTADTYKCLELLGR